MTFENLRALATVAEQHNLTAAAAALGCSQPAVAQHVKKLEAETGVELIDRHPRGVTLTPAGELLADAATRILATLSRAHRAIAELADPTRGTVRIATGGTTMTHFMTDTIAAFREAHPDVQLEFHSANSTRRCLDALTRDQVDLAFITISSQPPAIDTLPVLESGWTLVEPADRPDHRSKLSVRDLPAKNHYIAIHPHSTSGTELDRQLRDTGTALPCATTVDDWDTAMTLVELALGTAIIPALHAYSLTPDRHVRVTPIHDLEPLQFGWATSDQHRLPAPAHAFIAMFRDHRQLPAGRHTRLLADTWQRRRERA